MITKWKETKPQESGWYWADGDELPSPTIVLCYTSNGKPKLRYFYPVLEKHITRWARILWPEKTDE